MKNAVLLLILIIFALSLGMALAAPSKGYIYDAGVKNYRLSSGDILNSDLLTAGHPSIPVGTVVRVTNPTTSKTIDVLINDHWKTGTESIIITQRAANIIGLSAQGAPVNVQTISTAPPNPPVYAPITRAEYSPAPLPVSISTEEKKVSIPRPTTPRNQHSAKGLYFLEFGNYQNPVQAGLLARKVTKVGAPAIVVQDNQGIHHVISDGYFNTIEEASEAFYQIKENTEFAPVIKKI